ncbi:ogr/Delta-like zinc finger family protein [Serratia marcescens]
MKRHQHLCHWGARIRRYLTEQTEEDYYQCQNIDCSSTFKNGKVLSM